jgi:hypothetical protein
VAAAGALTDTMTGVATLTNAVQPSVGASMILRGAPYVAAPVAGITLLHGIQAGNSEEDFSGSYGLATLAVGTIQPEVALGMALAKLVGDLTRPSPPSIFDVAATLGPSSACTGK